MTPWREYQKDLKYIEKKFNKLKCPVDVNVNEFDDVVNPKNKGRTRPSSLVNFSRWVQDESQDMSGSQSPLYDSIEFENEREIRKQPERSVKSTKYKNDGSQSPLFIEESELEDWFKSVPNNHLEETVAINREDDLFERINKLERHICELVQLNRALIVSGARNEGIPMPELVWNNEKEKTETDDPPWKRNHNNRVRFKIPLSVKEEHSYSNLKFVPSTPVKDEGFLSRDENGVYFSPRINPTKKYMVHDAYPEYSSIHSSKSTNLYKSVINGQTPKKLLFK